MFFWETKAQTRITSFYPSKLVQVVQCDGWSFHKKHTTFGGRFYSVLIQFCSRTWTNCTKLYAFLYCVCEWKRFLFFLLSYLSLIEFDWSCLWCFDHFQRINIIVVNLQMDKYMLLLRKKNLFDKKRNSI